MTRRWRLTGIGILIFGVLWWRAFQPHGPEIRTPDPGSALVDPIARAFATEQHDVPVKGWGIVTRLMPDDNDGSRHQRFLLRTPSGVSVLVAHNIDLAQRLAPLAVGDTVRFVGEYVWNEQGGVLHWTHHDPAGLHQGGRLESHGVEVE